MESSANLFLPQRRLLKVLIVFCVFVGAVGIRCFFIETFDFAPFRQIRSAIIARAMYYEDNPNISSWEKDMARAQIQMESRLEPRISEYLAVATYKLIGEEKIWVPRFFSIIWWTIGGVFLLLIGLRLSSSLEYSLLASSFYLFLPFSAVASRGFQPDSFMVMFFMISLYAMIRYFEETSFFWFLLVGIFSGVAILIKPQCIFFLYGAFFTTNLWKNGLKKTLIGYPIFLYIFLSCFIGLSFYVYNNFHGASKDVSPVIWLHFNYWLKPTYWGGWLAQIKQMVSFPFFVMGLIGLCFLHRGMSKALLIGLWAGYFLFGLIFAYHISTHDYYQLLLVPVLAISLAPMFCLFFDLLKQMRVSQGYRLFLYGLCVFLGIAAIGIQIMVVNYDRHGRWQKNETQIAAEIGDYVKHSKNVLYLAISEGYPLRYYGKIAGAGVNIRSDAIDKYLDEDKFLDPEGFINNKNFEPEYFVITEILQYKRAPKLSEFLKSHFPLLVQAPDYMIFDLRKK